MDTPTPLSAATRSELIELAGRREIPRRHRMSKEQLIAELRQPGESSPEQAAEEQADTPNDGRRHIRPRVDAFQRLAEARAAGAMVLIPRMLTGNDRRMHVRKTVREDHENRIAGHDVEAQGKFDELAGSSSTPSVARTCSSTAT